MPTPAMVLAGPEWWPNLWLTPHLAEHTPIDSTTRLVWLADSIELRLPHVLVPVSPGDLLLVAGVIALVVTAMRRRVTADGAGPDRETPRSPPTRRVRDLAAPLPRDAPPTADQIACDTHRENGTRGPD